MENPPSRPRNTACASPPRYDSPASNTNAEFDPMDFMKTTHMDDCAIDDRNPHEESNWWDPDLRRRHKRPGPGILAPALAERLHDLHDSLFSVNVTAPQIIPTHPPTTNLSPAPSQEEVEMSVPHPNAYYCPKYNGWVILSWKSSYFAPPLAQSYSTAPGPPLPDLQRRRLTSSCIDDVDQPFANNTHHFHKYDKAVDSHKLTPPLRQDEWQSPETVQQRRRAATFLSAHLNVKAINDVDVALDDSDNEMETVEEGKLLDLYVCCQCSFYCIASGVIPGVIPRKHIDELVRDRKGHPSVKKNGEQAVVSALENFLCAIENKLWWGEDRMINVMSTGFQSRFGWNPNIKHIFELIGFTVDSDTTLKPPSTDLTATGRTHRLKLLRAWLEIGSWLTHFKQLNASQLKGAKKNAKNRKIYVQLQSSREMYQSAIGAHADQIPRGDLSDTMLDAVRPLETAWRGLGLTPTTFSADLFVFAYLAQCRCDPAGTPKYFTYLTSIVKRLQECENCPNQLQELLVIEQSRKRFTLKDVTTASVTLGFGVNNVLGVKYDEDIPEEFVENAWKDSVKRSWRDLQQGSETHRLLNEAFRILAESRGSIKLRRAWEAGTGFSLVENSSPFS